MNRSRWMKASLFPLVLGGIVLGLSGCQMKGNVIGWSHYCYDDYEKYAVGNACLTETVENIDIDWLVGNVTVLSHSEETISFYEESEKELLEETKLHYLLDDTTLKIRYCSCMKVDLSELEKDLILYVPSTIMIDHFEVSTLSANMNVSISTVNEFEVNTVSGKLEADFSSSLNKFNGSSTSGSFEVNASSISRFEVSTVSGEVTLDAKKEPDWLDIDSTSGSIDLIFPMNASFTLVFDTTSGDFSSSLAYRKENGKYIFKEGKGQYEIVTVSGDIEISSNQ